MSLAILAALALAPHQGPDALDSTFARWRAGPPVPAVAMAVVHRGRVIYSNVSGYADLEHRVPATLDTRFDWASIAKQFTAFAIAQLAEQGELSPQDPVRRYLPELDLDGAPITIEQLIHHTAGLEDSDGLMTIAGWGHGDAFTTADVVRVMLGQRHLRYAPGTQESYGNGGYALLTEIVARVSGTPFERYADSAIFKPLGLASASFAGPTDVVPDRAMPYVMRRGAFRVSSVDSYFGAGGLVATVGDLARWTMHVMRPAALDPQTRRLRERGHLLSGEAINYAWGLGWGSYRGLTTLAHAGSGPATSAQLTMFPDRDFAVVVAAAGDLAPDVNTLARRAADTFLAAELKPVMRSTGPQMMMLSEESLRQEPPESRGIDVPDEARRSYPGVYRFPDGQAMMIRAEGERLEFAFNARPPWFPFFPLPDGRFVVVPLWDAYRFIRGPAGEVTGMARERTPRSIRQRGDSITIAERMTLPAFDSTTAAPYLGVYHSGELNAFYEVAFNGSALVLHHARHGSMNLVPLGNEEFGVDSRAVTRVRFGRAGKDIVGMELRALSWDARTAFRKLRIP